MTATVRTLDVVKAVLTVVMMVDASITQFAAVRYDALPTPAAGAPEEAGPGVRPTPMDDSAGDPGDASEPEAAAAPDDTLDLRQRRSKGSPGWAAASVSGIIPGPSPPSAGASDASSPLRPLLPSPGPLRARSVAIRC